MSDFRLVRAALFVLPAALLAVPSTAAAGEPEAVRLESDTAFEGLGYHPWVHYPQVRTVDLSGEGRRLNNYISKPVEQPDFWSLDDHKVDLSAEPAVAPERDPEDALTTGLPDGWVQRGNVVLPKDVAGGLAQPELGPIFAVEDIPGNKYPRKHTLFMNFNGGMLYSGADNSAESKSNLAKQGVYPVFGGGETRALAIIQAVEADLAPYGVTVLFQERPRNVVPYTMEMMGGQWQDTNIDSPAGGVAPGADCGALGQRHVVYTFGNGGSTLGAASTASQEAGHAWGLDHTFNCSSVMSYCGSGDKSFVDACDGLCEAQCQGPNSAGCRLTHEMFCGEGTDTQNDALEMEWIFGGNEPDMEAPTVEIVEPVDGDTVEEGGDINLRALVDDNYGGFGWKFVVLKDGEVIYDQPDYERDVDDQFRPALNLVNLETGVYEISVEAEDHFGHITTQSVTVTVGDPAAATSGGDTDGGSDSLSAGSDAGTGDSGSDTVSGGDTDTDSGDSAMGTGEEPPDDSGCSVAPKPSSGGLALLMLGLAGVFAGGGRRRRA